MSNDNEYSRQLNEYYIKYSSQKCINTSNNPTIITSNCANIQLQQTVNIYDTLNKIIEDKSEFLTKLENAIKGNNKVEFNEVKNEIEKWEQKMAEYKNKKQEYDNKMQILVNEQNALKTDLAKTFYERQNVYKQTTVISNRAKTILMKVYKNEGMIKQTRVNALAKQLEIKETEINAWIKWFDLSLQYIRQSSELKTISKKIGQLEVIINNNLTYYEIQSRKVLKSIKTSKENKTRKIKIVKKKR